MIPKIAIPDADLALPEVVQAKALLDSASALDAAGRLAEQYDPRHLPPSVANLVGARLYAEGRPAEALPYFAHAASHATMTSEYSCNEGSALLLVDRPRESAHAYLRSLRGDRTLWEAHYWAWGAFNRLGISRDVIGCLRQALDNDPAQRDFTADGNGLALADVTLCVIDCTVPDLAARALRRSMAHCRFAEVKLLTSRNVRYDGIETVAIDHLASIEEYSRFVMKSLWQYISTSHVLVTQWDGYVTNPSAWTNQFLDFDYIGARWAGEVVTERGSPPTHDVGNGGFSLRSDIFLGAGQDPRLVETHPEDTHLAGTYRPCLERDYGIRFADSALAERFSFEIMRPVQTPFGFHGCFNLCSFEADPKWMRFEFLRPDIFAP